MLYLSGTLFALLILMIWVILLLNVSGIISWPKSITTSNALVVFGISLTLAFSIIWILNRIGILALADATEGVISKVLIASILGTVAKGIGKAFTQA